MTLWVCECDVALSDVQGYCAAVLCEQDKSNANDCNTGCCALRQKVYNAIVAESPCEETFCYALLPTT